MIVCSLVKRQFNILQRIIHPAHIPFIIETKTPVIGWFSDICPGSGFFIYHHCIREFLKDQTVYLSYEFNGFNIFSSAINIFLEDIMFAVKVWIKHACHPVHSDSVKMELLYPEYAVGQEKIKHFIFFEICLIGPPVFMNFCFIKRGAVKLPKAMCIHAKMSWDPVHNYANFNAVAGINKISQFIWISKS